MQVDDTFHIGIHTIAAIDNDTPTASLVHGRQLNVLQVANAADTTEHAQIIHQPAMYGRVNDRFGERGTHHGTFRKMCREFTVFRNQDIGMQRVQRIPGIAQGGKGIVGIGH